MRKPQFFKIPGKEIKLSWDTIEEIQIARNFLAFGFPDHLHPATLALVELAHLVDIPDELPTRPKDKRNNALLN